MATTTGPYYYSREEVEQLLGGSFMKKSDYDSNGNGIVDDAEAVNGHTVYSDVPANAVFTDTALTAGSHISITNGVISFAGGN